MPTRKGSICNKTKEFKRRWHHGREAKAQQELYEQRIGKDRNYGTYQAAIGVQSEQNKISNTQQSNLKLCKNCNRMKNHKTWISKFCVWYDEYLQQKQEKIRQRQAS